MNNYEELYKIIKERDPEDYEKSDLIIELFKDMDSYYYADCIDYILSELIDPQTRKEVLYNLTTTILEDIKKEYNQTTQKDDGFYNVEAHSLEDEYSIYRDFYDKIY